MNSGRELNQDSLKGIGLFGMSILSLISNGKKETFQDIEREMSEHNIVEYLSNKYQFIVPITNEHYDIATINKYFANFAEWLDGNERRKCGIVNEEDGLLLILSVLMNKVERESKNWGIEE